LFDATLQKLGDLTDERLHHTRAPSFAEGSIARRICDQMWHHPILLFRHLRRRPVAKDGFEVGADITGIEHRPGIHFMEPGKNIQTKGGFIRPVFVNGRLANSGLFGNGIHAGSVDATLTEQL